MKIGIFDPYLDTLTGGEKYMLGLARCLAYNHEVFLFWDTEDQVALREKINWKFGYSIDKIQFTKNIFDKRVSLWKRLSESSKFDMIVVLSDGSIPLVWCKLFVHFQTPMEWITWPSLKTRFKIKRIAKVICNSNFTKSYIDKKFGVQAVVVYPPVKIDHVDEKKENIILNVGRFGVNHAGSSYKKQDVMVDVFKKMVDQGLNGWEFVLIVSTLSSKEKEDLELLKQNSEKYPIKIIENPSNQVLWEYYAKAKVYWHAAGFGENLELHPDRAEHFGIATVEAMGLGAVPIVINAGGQTEIVQDKKSGVLWNTTEELCAKTKEVISDKKLWSILSKAARERAQYFAVERFCRQARELIS